MDIKVIGATTDGIFIYIERTHDGVKHMHKMPKETLAIRAAEYDLDPEGDEAFDMIMLEYLIRPPANEIYPPLYAKETVGHALEEVTSRIVKVKQDHGAPEGEAGILARAADNPIATPGLKITLDILRYHADRDIMDDVKYHRDHLRLIVKHAEPAPTLKQHLRKHTAAIRASVDRDRINMKEER